MSAVVFYKLLAVFVAVLIGWIAGRMRWLGKISDGSDPARTLGNSAFYIFIPALLFRTTARLDIAALPWATLGAFFVPVIAMMIGLYVWWRWRGPDPAQAADVIAGERDAAMPAARAFTTVFGNTVQIGLPLAAALFGEAGLGIHIAVVSLHALVLLSLVTVVVELDIARARQQHEVTSNLARTLRSTVRNTVIHPVVLPVLAGLAWNLTGWPLPGALDETLALLATAVAPLCLVLIGLSLAYYGMGGALGRSIAMALLKLLALPALVLAVAHNGFGLTGLPLQVIVMMAALPSGSNGLIFAQRYRSQEVEATTTIVLSTLGFVLTAPLWVAVLGRFG